MIMAVNALDLAIAVIPAILDTEPIIENNSVLTGQLYLNEILSTENENRFYETARMNRDTFDSLCIYMRDHGGLQDSRQVSLPEKLLIFIHVLRGHSYRQTKRRWQHSTATIHAVIRQVADAFMCIQHLLFVPNCDNCPPEIRDNPKWFPFFQNCIGALDGTKISSVVSTIEQTNFRDRKGNITQNVLGVCNFNLTYSYTLTGWEGKGIVSRINERAYH